MNNSGEKVKIAFINPPHADWCLPNLMTWIFMKSHYDQFGAFADRVEWLEPPYKYNQYQHLDEIFAEIVTADIVLFSSYVWNYDLCDQLAKILKHRHPEKVTILGGPHIGINDVDFYKTRSALYDYVCLATKPGEIFIESFLDLYLSAGKLPQPTLVAWEVHAGTGKNYLFSNISVYEQNFTFLQKLNQHAQQFDLEAFAIIETTRGCPYGCVYCEWGGGTQVKIIQKDIAIVKKDLLALGRAGFRQVYLTDANFGIFEKRDIEIFAFAFANKIALTDISTVKSKSLERRKRIVDAWFHIVGKGIEKNYSDHQVASKALTGLDMEFVSSLPTVSIQSISERAMEVAARADLCFKDKILLSQHIHKRCADEGYPVPALELILAMPGSTKEDFYNEMEIIWNFKAWNSFRHDYMFLPDTTLASEKYKQKYQIETVEVYTDLVDEQGIDNTNTLFAAKKNYFKTICSCFSFTSADMCEMYFMNLTGNFLLEKIYPTLETMLTPAQFGKACFSILQHLEGFSAIYSEIEQIYDTKQPARNIKKLNGLLRNDCIYNFLERNKTIIYSEIFRRHSGDFRDVTTS